MKFALHPLWFVSVALTFVAAGCSTHRVGAPQSSGVGASIDVLGIPRTTEGGRTSNRHRIYERRPTPVPPPSAPPPAEQDTPEPAP